MVSISARFAKLFVEQLENRSVLTNLEWPIAAADNQGIWATYGQFDDRTHEGTVGALIHFHAGIDILAGEGTVVKAVEGGQVVWVDSDVHEKYGNFGNKVVITTTADRGWNYIHMVPTTNLVVAYKNWLNGGPPVMVAAKAQIGNVANPPVGITKSHLHLDAGGADDPSPFFPGNTRPVADPLARLTPLGDTIAPTLGDIHFMRASDDTHNLQGGNKTSIGSTLMNQDETDRLQTHGYFKALDHSKAIIVGHYATAKTAEDPPVLLGGNSNIDIIANIYDQMTATGSLLGVRTVEFKATGQLVGKTIPTVTPYNFVGEFVWDPNRPGPMQTYEPLYISDLTQVVYQNDATSPSTSIEPNRSFFYILTNTDAPINIVDLGDRGRYWRSKVTQGAAWNDINSTEAVNNAKAAFPDDYYTFTVTAKDAAGNSKDKTQKVLLDNWPQNLTLVPKPGFPTTFILTGEHFTASAAVPIWLIYRDPTMGPTDGENLEAAGAFYDYAQTDANGNILPFEITSKLPGHYHVVADYGSGDVIYQPRLDGHTQTPEDKQDFVSITGDSLTTVAVKSSTPVAPPPADAGKLRPQIRLPTPDDPAAIHGTRTDTQAVSKLAVAVPERSADPLQLPGDFDG